MTLLTRLPVLAISVLLFSIGADGQQCTFSLSPASQSVPTAGGNFTISITASAGTCPRTVTTNVPWITISFGQTGKGSGSAGYTVLPNNTSVQRTATINVAGVVFNVTQAAGTCSYTLNPATATVAQAGGTGSFTVASGCNWTATSNASWIQVTGGQGSGDGTVRYSVEAYTGNADRTGTITVGSSTFTIRQTAACTFTTSSGNVTATAAGGTHNINVQGRDGCARTATSDVAWITITSGGAGEGNGTVGITVAANSTREYRIGRVLINGAAFVIVRQDPSTCVIQLNPRTASVSASGGTLSFGVVANCAWTAVSQSSWVQITSGATGNGPGTVTYVVGQNFDANPRGGTILINGETFVVSQSGASCEVFLSEVSINVPADGGTGTVRVNSLAGCTWTVSVSDDWIRITKNAGGGSGIDEVTFTVAVNSTSQERRGTILIGGKPVEIRQAAARCTLALERSSVQIAGEGGRGELRVTANCSWTAAANVGWIQITGTTQNMLTYSVSPNEGSGERTGIISVTKAELPERQTLTISQSGQRCSVTLSGSTASLPARGGTNAVSVNGGAACSWSASTNAGWLRIEWSSVSGSGNIRFSADPNTTGADRTGTIVVAGQTITVQQPAVAIRIAQTAILNAASFAGGAIAPGEVITIFGTGFGPEALTTLQLAPNGDGITNVLAETRVLFDGEPAPMLYAVDGQLSAIAPYAIGSKQNAGVQVEYLGVRSNVVTMAVTPAAPGIFTAAATGRGQAAVLNQDFSVNGSANAAARNSVIQIFATGEGETRPAGIDGRLAGVPLPIPVLPVRVFVGGIEAVVTYAGAAPGLVAGVLQVNAQVPEEVQPGPEVPVVIRVGTADSPAGPTIAVR